ncbi:tRNA-dependent cyclodipeptide synthase [Streptomyces sp. AHA2]|uniref:tRNA-dependent cyclodipeptide synthase n=1 Tax=Streptomyces sp. AHA2 TaxID=3064526 RepID=UPI002FE41B8F
MGPLPGVTIRPLTDQCSRVYERREHALFGMSPCNSYFSKDRIRRMLQWGLQEFESVHVFLPDYATRFTFLALGYEQRAAEKKARTETNALRNRIKRALRSLGVVDTDALIIDWNRIREEPAYLTLLARAEETFETDTAFRRACLDASREVIKHQRLRGRMPEEARLRIAVRYVLLKMPTFLDTAAIIGARSSVRCYHRPAAMDRALFAHRYSLVPAAHQGYLQVEFDLP